MKRMSTSSAEELASVSAMGFEAQGAQPASFLSRTRRANVGTTTPPRSMVIHEAPRWEASAAVVLAVVVWLSLGVAVAVRNGNYSGMGVVLVLVGWIAAVLMVFIPRMRVRVLVRNSIVAAALAMAVATVAIYPAGLYGKGGWLVLSHELAFLAVATTALLLPFVTRGSVPPRVALALITVLSAGASVAMVVSSPHPRIDVWSMYQAASRGLLHGHDPYGLHWTSGMPGEVSNGFSYLPGSALVLAPFQWLFGDVRYGLIVAIVVAAWCVFSIAQEQSAWLLASLILNFPKESFGVEQAWNEPLLFAFVAVFVALMVKRRFRGTLVALVAAVTCAQYGLLYLPLAAGWRAFGWKRLLTAAGSAAVVALPWMIADWHQAWYSVVVYPMKLPARLDSLSLYTLAMRHGWVLGFLPLVSFSLIALVLCWLLIKESAVAFCAAAALVMFTFAILNKEVFFNDWQFVASLTVLAAAVISRPEASLDVSRPYVAVRQFTQILVRRRYPAGVDANGGRAPTEPPASNDAKPRDPPDTPTDHSPSHLRLRSWRA